MRRFICVPILMLYMASPASAACDGDACLNGILRVCQTLKSGDGVWVNKTPFTRCQTRQSKPAQESKPRAARSTCVSMKNYHARLLDKYLAECMFGVARTAQLAAAQAKCEVRSANWAKQWEAIGRLCPEYAGKKLGEDGSVTD